MPANGELAPGGYWRWNEYIQQWEPTQAWYDLQQNGDPAQGTNVVYSNGDTQHFDPSSAPVTTFLTGGTHDGVISTNDPSEIAARRADARTRGWQEIAKIAALVGGGAALGATPWGSAAPGTNYATGATAASDAAFGSLPESIGAEGVGAAAGGAAAGGTAGGVIGTAGVANPTLLGSIVGAAGGGGGMASNWLNWANLGSTILGVYGANRAADAQVGASDAAISESRRQFDTARGDVLPAIRLGQDAVGKLGALNNGDYSALKTSPDYNFNLAEGQKAIDRSLAARGMALSGAGVKEGVRYASGMASNQYGSFYDRLLASAGLGTTGAAASANAGTNSAALVGNAAETAGNARASGYSNMYGALQGGLQNQLLKQYLRL